MSDTLTTTNRATADIVAKLWNLCNLLRDDGVTYHQYVTELTYLLFLKMAQETGTEGLLVVYNKPDAQGVLQSGPGTRWADLLAAAAPQRFVRYEDLLRDYARYGQGIVQEIYANASTFIKKPATLSSLISEIDKLDWYNARKEGLGDLYEGLLEKNANEKKSGAGQYFTPRKLIDAMVEVMQPKLGEVIQDPAAGTGGFLIAANAYLRAHHDTDSLTEAEQKTYRHKTFYGMEHVQDTQRLALMNLMLHGIDSDPKGAGIRLGDTLSPDGQDLPPATLILTNPPFGTKKGGGLPTRDDFVFPTSNKQFAFLQHIYKALAPGGRAAVVLPDNVLFESNVGTDIRLDLMRKCSLHTILRLPTGIFYAQGVKTNVLFFTRGFSERDNTTETWVYDLRANMPQFGKRTVLTKEHFADFIRAYGPDPAAGPIALSQRVDTGLEGRFRRFTREDIAARNGSLDIAWLKDENAESADDLPEPAVLAGEASTELEAAIAELQAIIQELGAGETEA